ncbi:PREDICTED: MLO-like protein 4 isoform X2 [Nicotiana attenuata]|uniref:MLO-like protein n=1 Tax=Nicotiana attenuata TaxID=49451 RepID=A0A314LCH4_NICAT|nr:PREDICTED: MLO-like protein 4 isoform X2 [Nicotiana attenuata]OIT38739.1 mlo-like protein 4 [Nicotiana attenuata]
MEKLEEASFAETPTWAVATVVTVLVSVGFLIHGSLKKFGKWLHGTKRKPLYAALEKIKEELMVFGLLSLLMGHWIIYIAKICVKSSALSSHFYPCSPPRNKRESAITKFVLSGSSYLNSTSSSRLLLSGRNEDFCPEGLQSFASKESLEQLHRFLLVLGVSHVSYSFLAIALAMIKIYSWRTWENYAKSMALQRLEGSEESVPNNKRMGRISTFTFHHTAHPWSQHRALVWLLCFSRQFWSSINEADYMALRLGFITTHQLPLTYDFHKYMLRSMEEEFRDIVGISVPLWIFVILCVFLSFHGTNIYFWISFFPAILILLVGTKLHHVVVKLAVEIMDSSPREGFHQFNLRDELFWFGKPRLLLRIIQFISFQNAFEMATYIWSLWEIKGSSCFTKNQTFLVIRLSFGVISQFWCSFVTFPLYVIVAQMGSRYKKTIVSENVRKSLHGWRHKVKTRLEGSVVNQERLLATTALDSVEDETDQIHGIATNSTAGCSPLFENTMVSDQQIAFEQNCTNEISECDDELHVPFSPRH